MKNIKQDNREIKIKQNPYNDYMSIVKIAQKHIARAEGKVIQRCLIEGCRYGVGLPLEEPQERCIYCGQHRPEYEENQITSFLKKHKSL